MSTMPVDSELLERLRSPTIITTIVVVFLAFLYASIQDTPYDPLHLLFPSHFPFSSEIVQLRIYPIKSCRGIQVSSRQLLRTGLFLDRNWMFVDAETKKFITIRQHRKMTLIRTTLRDDQLEISIRNQDWKISIPAPPSKEWLEANCTLQDGLEIWGENTDGWAYDAGLIKPISELLGKEVRLVYKGPTPRLVAGSQELMGRDHAHYFADMMSVLVASESSLKELNTRLRKGGHDELTIERFRPNVIIKGGTPWMEDQWKKLRIYDSKTRQNSEEPTGLEMEIPVRCLRCRVPNVEPETAERSATDQPWKTLMGYRNIDDGNKQKPAFGVLCLPLQEGKIEVGMRLEVLETTKNHVFGKTPYKDL
ncbi:MAG: hypothetical protein M1820_009790 [Bogoriella megaspora]|nr:MAG: hypothetical protein M1820_009790 [Bogoriella megaspora]